MIYTTEIIKSVYRYTGFFSSTDIFNLLKFQLKQPDNLALNILLVELDWDIYVLRKIAIHMNFSKLV